MCGAVNQSPRSVTGRALSVLGTFDVGHVALTLSEISRRSGLPLATTHRLVAELVTWGALVRTDGVYQIGHRIWSLGLLAPVHRGLNEVARPYMQDVLQVTKNVVNLFTLDGGSALLLERLGGTDVGQAVLRVGERMSAHACAGGKVLLAYAEDEEIVSRALDQPRRYTPQTEVEPARLRRELATVRRRGYATTSGEAAVGTSGVAIPVTGADRRVVAALGVVVMGHAVNPGAIVPVLQVAARGITRQLRHSVDVPRDLPGGGISPTVG
ncbi:IclR family transcriptional regulator [Spiractinospora alimapuensis]|uniref:IclR family transcriptional regulator n=1 Tax=Spiractinospora alimapuensis TaxID=2820884 RepID=UPI001F225B95|nr:IclR family transcriptional regulator [Spiractinospora alimapuensis]QVQ51215.1 IclR family transcriptional regulator [Spiractinospora alimapuensis]